MNNLHISLTDFQNESRVLKEAQSILLLNQFNTVFVAALHSEGLKEFEKIENQIEAKRFKLKTRNLSKNLITQAIKYLEFTIRIIFHYKNKNIAMVNIHNVSLLPLGYFLKLYYGSKLIYDTHELETETNGKKGVRKKLIKLIEKLFIKKTNHIFVVSENIANWYQKQYKITRPTVIFNSPNYQHIQKQNKFRENLDITENQLIVLYQGNLARGRGISLILSAFMQRNDNTVVIVFMGYGELEEDIKNTAKQSDHIFFHPAVPPDTVLNYTSSADIGISFIENTCLSYYYCMPNKLFEYTMAGLPVIVSNMKEMREMVEHYNIGTVVEDGNGRSAESINSAINKLLTIGLNKLRVNTKRAAIENTWEAQEARMLKVYKKINFGARK